MPPHSNDYEVPCFAPHTPNTTHRSSFLSHRKAGSHRYLEAWDLDEVSAVLAATLSLFNTKAVDLSAKTNLQEHWPRDLA